MLVSACIIVYNHEKFLESCIEGAINQQVDFDYEIIIRDDCSTDKSFEICNAYALKYPNLIKFEKQNSNLGMYGNWMDTLFNCRGKYVALCEGDDYWTDLLKLQKQVDYLEEHPNFEVCFTNIRIVDENDSILKEALISDGRKTEYERKDLPIWAPTLTRVFRNRDFSSIPSAPGLDTVMLLWQSQFGYIKFLDEITGTYRKHVGGIYSAQSEVKRKEQIITTNIISLDLIDSDLYAKYFGMLFKKLVELRFLDLAVFKQNKNAVKNTYSLYKNQIDFNSRLKIQFAFMVLALPYKLPKTLYLKTFNRLFIY